MTDGNRGHAEREAKRKRILAALARQMLACLEGNARMGFGGAAGRLRSSPP